jgi:hypothetical protein
VNGPVPATAVTVRTSLVAPAPISSRLPTAIDATVEIVVAPAEAAEDSVVDVVTISPVTELLYRCVSAFGVYAEVHSIARTVSVS